MEQLSRKIADSWFIHPCLETERAELIKRYQGESENPSWEVVWEAHRTELRANLKPGIGSEGELSDLEKMRPLELDLVKTFNEFREGFKKSSFKDELLAKAVGIKKAGGLDSKGHQLLIMDATAGLAKDTMFLVAMEAKVMAVERHPLLCFLMEEALLRARVQGFNFFQFYPGKNIEILADFKSEELPDVIYFDPMYSERNKKSADPHKGMQFLKNLVGSDEDQSEIAEKLKTFCKKRLVIKRPIKAPPLLTDPSVVFKGRSTRYDVYIVPA